jgi:GT2 family glycosyltransferase
VRLTAVVPNFETAGQTLECVASLVADGVPPHRIVVVDDGSSDGSAGRLAEALDGPRLLARERNGGYGAACNAGAAALRGDAYLLVNSDAFVHRPGSVAALVDALEEPRVGIAVPRVLNPDLTLQPTVVPAHTPLPALVRASGLSRFVPDRWQPLVSTHWSHAEARAVPAAIGAVLLVRGTVWDVLGGFDERFFMYAEDHDLCLRANAGGWLVWFTPAAEFVHLGNATGARRWSSPRRAELIGRAEARMLRRHAPVSAGLTLAFTAAGLAARWALARARGDAEAAASYRASVRGYLARD